MRMGGQAGLLRSAGWVMAASGCLIGCPKTMANEPATAPQPNVSEEYLKLAADQERAVLGLPPLRFDAALSAAARRHAGLMVEHMSISHQYTGEPGLANRAAAAGARFSLITENVARAPSAVIVHTAWMRSEGHRHNLLDPNVDSVGISVISHDGQMFAVEDFARTVATLSLPQQESAVAAAVRSAGVTVEVGNEDARQVCAGSSSAAMAPPPEFVMRYTTDDLGRLPSELANRLRSPRYGRAVIGACAMGAREEFSMYKVAVLLYRRDRPGM